MASGKKQHQRMSLTRARTLLGMVALWQAHQICHLQGPLPGAGAGLAKVAIRYPEVCKTYHQLFPISF